MNKQKQLSTDIYNILKNSGYNPINPNDVSIYTEKGMFKVKNYYFNSRHENCGHYKHKLNFRIKEDYTYEELKKVIKELLNLIFVV